MSRATQFAVIVAVVGTLLLGSSTAAPQPSPSRVTALRGAAPAAAAPDVCFANRPCPGPHAAICFAGSAAHEPNDPCPAAKVTFRFAQAPPGERR